MPTTLTNEKAVPAGDTVGTTPLTHREVAALVARTKIMTGGLSNMLYVEVVPGAGWAANVDPDHPTLMYDVGLAAILAGKPQGDAALTGVIAHEIGHLRSTDALDTMPGVEQKDIPYAHDLLNLVEDKRIEIIMSRTLPGIGAKIDSLRSAMANPALVALMGKLTPDAQLKNAIYAKLWDEGPAVPTDPAAAKAWAKFERLFDGLLAHWRSMAIPDIAAFASLTPDYMATEDLWEEIMPVYAALTKLRVSVPNPDGGTRDSGTFAPDPGDDDYDDGDAGYDYDPDASDDDDDDPADADGGDADTGADEGNAGEGDDDAPTKASGSDDDADSGDDEAGDITAGVPTTDDIATLPSDVRARIWGQLQDAKDAGLLNDEEAAKAQEVSDAITTAETEIVEAGEQVTDILEAIEQGVDDAAFRFEADPDAYTDLTDDEWDSMFVLGRRFASILRENAYDRWTPGYKSGARINERSLAAASVGRMDVFRRKARPKNRRYAVSIVCDTSASMRGSRATNAIKATLMAAGALDTVDGMDVAVYGYGSKCGCLKPFDRSWKSRRDFMGELAGHKFGSNSTYTASAMRRVGDDLVKFQRGNHDVRRLLIVLTDGTAHDQSALPATIKRLSRGGVEVIAIGIQMAQAGKDGPTQGIGDSGRPVYPAWSNIDEVAELPAALKRAIASRVRKG